MTRMWSLPLQLKDQLAKAKDKIKDLGPENATLRELLKAADRANDDLKAKLAALAAAANKRRGILDDEVAELTGSADALAADLRARDAELQDAKENVLQVCMAFPQEPQWCCFLPWLQTHAQMTLTLTRFFCMSGCCSSKKRQEGR